MKRYILAICCMAFIVQVFAQPKTYYVHKKDGTTLKVPCGVNKLDFSGKAVVNDGDYIDIDSIMVASQVSPGEQPYALVQMKHLYWDYGISNYERIGICYATEPDVTVENGVVVEGKESCMTTQLSFNTTYYCRSFILWRGKYYYSPEKTFTLGKPTMAWYGLDIPENLAREGIYVHPTDEAWEALFAKETSLTTDEKYTEARATILKKVWREYLTIDKAKELSKGCTQQYDCEDGTIYLLSEIGDDFMAMFEDFETNMYGEVGLLTDDTYFKNIELDTIVCPDTMNVPGNVYYTVASTASPNGNPSIYYRIDKPLLVGRNYEVEIIMAPEAEADVTPLPNVVQFRYLYGNVMTGSTSASWLKQDDVTKFTTNAQECSTYKFVITPEYFAENAIQIRSVVPTSQQSRGEATNKLRIASIKVTPVDVAE